MKFVNSNSGWMPNNKSKYFLQKISLGFNNQFNNSEDFLLVWPFSVSVEIAIKGKFIIIENHNTNFLHLCGYKL